ncbi:sialic acid-binding Ig-like lectin 6 isoform X3 [Cervus canadensis]|uniref:sialic acid-binding Ig-like lectin 6 isoform X3 n=1 Tax=Cervus canadensis TaxID=1574408 RepID=UPI001CA329DC|nr:sialic acid-binding Ig-like lectin 6 isoform X3 [Cervus canadensis]
MRLLLLLLPLVLWGAPLAQRLELRQNVIVQEGLCVLLPCTFPHPWVSFGKIYMFWFREGADTKHDPLVATNKPVQKLHEGTQGRFSLPREPQARNCSLSIMDVNAGDSGTYFFRAETHFRKFPYLNKMFFLNVTALTHQPHVLSPGALEAGRPGNLTCSVPWACERAMPPIFSWTSAAPSSLGPRAPFSSVLTLTPRPQDHGSRLTCQVKFPRSGAMVERTILLNVTSLKILQNTSSLPVQEGQVLRLLCAADSNPPAQLSWFRGSPALEVTAISSTGVLELPRVGAAEEEVFTCQAQNPLGSQNISLSLSVVCKPQPRASKVLGAVGGASVTVLLSLCLYLLFRVKTHRKTQPVQSMDDTNHAVGSGSRERQPQFSTEPPADHPAPAGAGPISRNEQEPHYAFLRFHKPKPQKKEGTHTEYSEIKIHK